MQPGAGLGRQASMAGAAEPDRCLGEEEGGEGEGAWIRLQRLYSCFSVSHWIRST